MLSNNYLALFITFVLAVSWLRVNDLSAQRGWISSGVSRKIIHAGTGPLFVACWLLFDNHASARWLAAIVPLVITTQFFLVGTGLIRDQAAVQAMSRSGDRREILRGPLYYGMLFVSLTLVFWRDTPTGIVALMLMCGGDGLADILGRRFGRVKLPWNPDKSWVGSLGMLFGGFVFALAIIWLYLARGVFPGGLMDYVPAISLIALAGTIVESFPFEDIDNLTITAVAVLLGYIIF